MPERLLTQSWKYAIISLLSVASLAAVMWLTKGFVTAVLETKTVHVFPTSVSAVGWEADKHSLTSELPADAPFASFSKENSAYSIVGGADTALPVETPIESAPVAPVENSEALPTEAMAAPEVTETVAPILDAVSTDIPAQEVISETLVMGGEAPLSSEPVSPTVVEEAVISNEPVPSAEISTPPVDSLPPVTSSGLSGVPDIAACSVLGTPCHTLAFSGFRIGGELLDKQFDRAEVNFSFAHMVAEGGVLDGKLSVHYFHDGQWRVAGEVYLNKEISNATNGGYFSQELDDIAGWDDLTDVQILLEYEPSDEYTPVELYVDAVWIDVLYAERVQDILSGDVEDPTDAPKNIAFDLSERPDSNELVLENGETISFANLTVQEDSTLTIKSDRSMYRMAQPDTPLSVYASITNSGSEVETFNLSAAFPEGAGAIVGLSQYLRNVPVATTTTEYGAVSYFCEAGWQQASTTKESTCLDSGETYVCESLNEQGDNCAVSNIPLNTTTQTVYQNLWVPLEVKTAGETEDHAEEIPAGYRETSVALKQFDILPGQTLYFKIDMTLSEQSKVAHFVLLAQGQQSLGLLDSTRLKNESTLEAQQKTKEKPIKRRQLNDQVSEQTNFDGSELPEFRFKFSTQRSLFGRLSNWLQGEKNDFKVAQATLKYLGVDSEDISVEVTYSESEEWSLAFKKHPRAFRPGKYTIELTMQEGEEQYVDAIEFYWGVLAVNTNKSVYDPGESVQFMLAALDDVGSTLCDALLVLSVTNPEGSVTDVPVQQSGQCGPNNVVDVADYLSYYTAGGVGVYQVTLTHIAASGAILNTISDSFEVQDSIPYVVARSGPTRIYPKAPYFMDITVTARQAFSGNIVEALPMGTVLLEKDGGELSQYGEALRLTWDVSLEQGETRRFRYQFDSPDISPYLYVFGPLEMRVGDALAFTELRSWKIASDALGGYVEKYAVWSPTATTTWEVKDLSAAPFSVPANAVLEIALVNSGFAAPQAAGVRHASSSLLRRLSINQAEPQGTSFFTMHVQASATSSIQTFASSTDYVSFVLLGYWTDGYYQERFDQIDPNITDNTWGNTNLSSFGVASGTVAEMIVGNWNTANERNGGIRTSSSSLSRIANIHQSTGGGVNGATMLVQASSSNATIQVFGQVEGANNADIDYWLGGYWNTNPTGLRYTERFDDLTGGPTATSTWQSKALDTFGVPSGGIAEILFANVSATSTTVLMGVRSTGSTIDRTFDMHQAAAGGWVAGRAHVKADTTASAAFEFVSEDVRSDTFKLFGYWSASNTPPAAPTLYDNPFDSQKTGSSTPYIFFSATDPDGASALMYEIQWDDDAVLDDAPLGHRYSNNESGCSPNCFYNVTTPLENSPFTEGNQIRFQIQTALVSGTTYYWRTRATDVTGSNLSGDWSTVKSFTYLANTLPPQWFQTQDAQFDTGTYDNLQSYGSNGVRVISSAPTEAMVAYADGAIQTPRYRLWNGTSWGAQLSAQSVGGTIHWMSAKAGTQRNEYILATQDSQSDINVQVYNGTSTAWSTPNEVTTGVSNTSARGFDVAYETTSGDALIVYCDGDADPSYQVWNGTGWSGPSSLNLSSANNCEWIKLASDPISDEIIVVARDTGTQYEAVVWDGSTWTLAVTLGSMTEIAHEGIAVEYEESGNQALVAVSNGNGNNIAWVSWDGTIWGTPTTHALGDDFEWGVLKADSGSDNMVLCYADNDEDLGMVRWDGSAWQTNQEHEQDTNTGSGNTVEGRSVSCEFETTAGRDSYIMNVYSDLTNGRYTVWNGSAYSAEASTTVIEDSWNVGTVRTGDGKILAYFHDDINTRYDFSYWNGSAWSSKQVLGNTLPVTAEPFREPITMVAKRYAPSSGTLTSAPISFSLLAGESTWGEVLWNATVPSGTNMFMQVMYSSGGVCTALVPDVALAGNSLGFPATSSPLDISGVSTTTYSGLCLRATLVASGGTSPTLDDWTLSWRRQPKLTQEHYRWYANAASSLTPTDPWPAGATNIATDTPMSVDEAPNSGSVLRLRMSLLNENVTLSSGAKTFSLQYTESSDCSASTNWVPVGAIGSTTAAWRGYDNAALTDGAALSTFVISSSTIAGTYEEENDSATNPYGIPVNQQGEWDWVLEHNALAGTEYCFRVITGDGEELGAYNVYPSLITNDAPGAPTLTAPFDNEALASTSPWFEFSAEDPEGNTMTYNIQVDDDYAFGSPLIDRDSQVHLEDDEFANTVTDSDKDPFNSSEKIRFIPITTLTDNTTYYWRVRAKDRSNSATWSDWSTIYSVTASSTVAISTWHQTRFEQFATDTFDSAEATSTHEVVLTPPATAGTTTSAAIEYSSHTTGNAWGELSWNNTVTLGTIRYRLEYWTGSAWALIPDTDLSGNSSGFTSSPISLLGLSPSTYSEIRIRANFTYTTGTPRLLDWTIKWGYAVEQPVQTALFDNEKTATTTPTFLFSSVDPQSNDLVYELSISTTNDFVSSTTKSSDLHSGFANVASSTDASPFTEGDSISFKVQAADVLTNGQTYWWRVRAKDPAPGGDTWSVWSDIRSFTVDTSVLVSTWFQTTDSQFSTDELNSTEVTGSGSARITSTIREAFAAYSEGTVQSPRYRIWNGTTWGSEQTGTSVGDTIRFVESAAAPTRDEYMILTQGAAGIIRAQVYNGTSTVTGNLVTMSTASNLLARGFDIAYETTSGDALAVSCYGTEAVYRVWDGFTWTATSSITLSVSTNCAWVKLASDPTSDEIILVVRDSITGATDYEALVWTGSGWGNSMTMGSQAAANNEGIAIEYEESGGQAVVIVSNGAANNFIWNYWTGSGWFGTATVGLGNDFAGGRLVRDLGSDNMVLCYIDASNDIGYSRWTGAAFTAATPAFEILGNSLSGRPVSCEFETVGSRDGYIMIPYADTAQSEYVYWDGALLAPAAALTTIGDSWEIRTTRTGDGNILAFAYDDRNTEYDFTYWNGTSWSNEEVLESTSIASLTPRTIPLDIVARRYPAFTSGTVVSDPIVFSHGSGPKWGSLSFTDTTPGSSDILYQLQYYTSTSSWAVIPNSALAGNTPGTSTSPLSLAGVSRTTYSTIRLIANLSCVGGNCPTLSDWTLKWSEGITISGTAKQYDQTTNVTSGTVAVAVNGVLQIGKTGVISGGTWSITNVTAFTGDIITVFVTGAGDSNEAVAVTKYATESDITGMALIEGHLSLGSDDNPTLTNANLSQYDYSASGGNEDIFYEIDAGNDFTLCPTGVAGCTTAELIINSGATYRPDSASSGDVTAPYVEINGTFVADGNTIYIIRSWDNNATFTKDTSTVVFTATSTTETVDSTGASSASFNNVTFGQTSGTATWSLVSALDITGSLAINYGTLAPSGTNALNVSGNLTIGANGLFTKGTGTTTFNGSVSRVWTDNTSSKQDMGLVLIDGTSKTVTLGSGVKTTNLTIGADDTLDVTASNYAIEVQSNWTNNNTFIARSGTVTFTSTATGKTIVPGSSSFYNLTFNGVGGNWAFSGGTVTVANDFTIATGTVTLPTATTTVTGSFDTTGGGTFAHNNGAVVFNSSSSKTIKPGTSSFYDLSFTGSGAWSFPNGNATSSRNTTISSGAVTLPSGTLVVGGAFTRSGGSFGHNSGTLKFTASNAQTITLGNSSAYNTLFAGTGTWVYVGTNATSSNNVIFESGTTTLPSGTFAVGGSLTVTSGAFVHNSGTVKFTATATGNTVTPYTSNFYNVWFNGVGGGWTITQNATSSNNTTLTNASAFTVATGTTFAVRGTFANSVGGSATWFGGATLSLAGGGSYALNTKSDTGDVYGILHIGTSTKISMWNSSTATATTESVASLYSQNNAGVSGDLYIFGTYTSVSGEYWSYAADFDGTVLTGGSRRQANVRIASSSSVTLSSNTLQILGTSTATTTVANQGEGAYSLSVTGGTINAQYYQIRNTDGTGVSISGATTITSLANGDFQLGVTGGSMLTLAAAVINQNPALQIQQVRFATSTGVESGYNVTETGTPTSYWWFRNHYGNFAGEQYDNDIGGNPGYVRFDDSGFNITVSGHVFSDYGSNGLGNPPCDSSTHVVTIAVGGATYTGSCVAGSGLYTIENVQFAGDAVLTTYLNSSSGGRRAATITKTPTSDITNLELYENVVIVRHEDTAPITIADLALYDSTDDSSLAFTAATGTPNTLVVRPNNELLVWTGKTFAPGGNMTLQSGGGGSSRDGSLYLNPSATFTAAGTEAHSIGGNFLASTSAVFSAANSTLTFAATTTGKTILSTAPLSLYGVVFNGTGGEWTLQSAANATTTIQNSLTLTAGTLKGTGDIVLETGGVTGGGVIAMTGGEFKLQGTGNFGNSNIWQFKNLTFGSGSAASTTRVTTATTTVTGVLTVASNYTLNIGNAPVVLSGNGTPFVRNGTFAVMGAPFYYTATTSTSVLSTTYAALSLVPSASGSPIFTLLGGTLSAASLLVGDGTNAVSVTADTIDPSISITGDVTINSGATLTASNVGAFNVGGSWTNGGTFTHSNGAVLFNASATGKIITPGTSAFYDIEFSNASGGWTIAEHATSTRHTTLTSASAFTLASGKTLEVKGTFTNLVGGSATTFATSTLYLNSGTSYSANSKTAGGDIYGTVRLGTGTHVRVWDSSAATTTTVSNSSLYSQNHAAVSGDLYIWGDYTRSSGSDYWSYATDFDGTDISGTPRTVAVRIASSSSVTLSGGLLDIIGSASASTTIAVQTSGAYAFAVSGGTLNAQYYTVRNTNASGLALSGSPTITSLSGGDFELGISGGSMITVAGSVIDANPLKILTRNIFATSSGVASGFNVTATGSSGSSWKFNLHYGNYDGEPYNSDPLGDPGLIRWDDSASQITISGRVYSDEGSTVSAVCNGSTQVVVLKVQGLGSQTSSCDAGGLYSFSNISFNPGDTLTVFLDTNGAERATTVSVDPVSNISNMDLYENRVIVRHEDANPMTILAMTQYDSDQDADIAFDAEIGGTNTVVVQPNTKLIVWDSKTFAPGGNVTIQSGTGANSYDGSLAVRTSGVFTAAGTEAHSIGGSFTLGSGATLTGANATFTFTATTTGKTITLGNSSFYNLTFDGVGGNWSFSDTHATTSNNFTVATGTVTLPTGVLTVGGTFDNSGGAFQHNNGTVVLTATATGKNIRARTSNFYNLTANGVGGGWTFLDTHATSSRDFTVATGTVVLPTSVLAVGNSFTNTGVFTAGSSVVAFTATASGKTIQAGGSSFASLFFNGSGGEWTFLDTHATSTADVIIGAGTAVLPPGTFAVGGSFINTGGVFTHSNGTVKFNATATGKVIQSGTSNFYSLLFNGSGGGWTISENATSTHDTTISVATNFTVSPNVRLAVGGTFTNLVGGSATTWATSTLSLYSGTSYTLNTKSAGGDVYGTLLLATTTHIRMWGSSAATTTTISTSSVYSQNHGAVSGSLYIYGIYSRNSGNDYWSRATDFDGTDISGSPRQVNVRIASSSILSFTGGTLAIVGNATATTTVANQGAGSYSFAVSGGTLNALYYQFRNIDGNGLQLSGTPTISSLSYGNYELGVIDGAMITVAGSVIDANASMQIFGVAFGTSTGVSSGFNIVRTGSPISGWTFQTHSGNYDGEAYDSDGGDACGYIRWSDSSCLFVSQSHYRWRTDDGGEGELASLWYNASWSSRKKVAITNPNTTSFTDYPVRLVVDYDVNMKSDFSDLRFTDSSGTVAIPFFVERTIASASSTVWVKVPSLPGSSSAVIYMYFGNAAASSASDGDTTFTFYESFESGSLAAYSGETASKFAINTTFNQHGSNGLDAGTHTTEKTLTGMYRTGSHTAQGQTIRYFQYVSANGQDEPCTLFGVQGSGSNYAVCLDEYPLSKVQLVKNVTSNDGSGTNLSSTTVTYTAGWYEVSIDWLTTNVINVTVYNASGAVFATTSATDSTHTSGGVGFSYWSQSGGWDFYTTRQYAAASSTAVFGVTQTSDGATWHAAEDTLFNALSIDTNVRLRFSIQNTGSNLTDQYFRLQVAPKSGALNCESVSYINYEDVPNDDDCGTSVACMATSTQFIDQAGTAGLLSYPASMNFVAGKIMEDPSNETTSFALNYNTATEVEYNFQMTSNATDSAYCFRVSESGNDLDNYDHVAEAVMLHGPILTNLSFNSAQNIVLTEGATTTIIATGTVTDQNGYADIVTATSTMYRSALGPSCATNPNNCYQIAAPACTFSNCSGNACSLMCSAPIEYLADATDAGSAYEAQNWLADITVTDSTGLKDTETSLGVDILTLFGLALDTEDIDFGTLSVGQNTGSTNAVTTLINTGNSQIVIELAGTNLTGGSNTIPVGEQKFATSTFAYGSCAICQFLTEAAVEVDVDLPKSTSTTTPSTDDLYWGINIPTGIGANTYQGTNTFIATGG